MVSDKEVAEKIRELDEKGHECFMSPTMLAEIKWFDDFDYPKLKDGGLGRAISSDGKFYKMEHKNRKFYFSLEKQYGSLQVHSRSHDIPEAYMKLAHEDAVKFHEFFEKMGKENYEKYFGFNYDREKEQEIITLYFNY
jgi:hypothetical protein